jgi:hypothetical protein
VTGDKSRCLADRLFEEHLLFGQFIRAYVARKAGLSLSSMAIAHVDTAPMANEQFRGRI